MTELTVIDQTNLVRPHGRADLMCDLQAGETQCTARSKRTGERCKRASSLGSNVCRVRSAANKSSDGARPVIGPCTAKRPDAGACEIRLYEGVFGRVPESFKTNVLGVSSILSELARHKRARQVALAQGFRHHLRVTRQGQVRLGSRLGAFGMRAR
jgi:hypothetical protein